jgi:hypothetical protein
MAFQQQAVQQQLAAESARGECQGWHDSRVQDAPLHSSVSSFASTTVECKTHHLNLFGNT